MRLMYCISLFDSSFLCLPTTRPSRGGRVTRNPYSLYSKRPFTSLDYLYRPSCAYRERHSLARIESCDAGCPEAYMYSIQHSRPFKHGDFVPNRRSTFLSGREVLTLRTLSRGHYSHLSVPSAAASLFNQADYSEQNGLPRNCAFWTRLLDVRRRVCR